MFFLKYFASLSTALHGRIDSFLPFLEHGVFLEDPCTLHHMDPNLRTQYQHPHHTGTGNLRDYSEIRDCLSIKNIY